MAHTAIRLGYIAVSSGGGGGGGGYEQYSSLASFPPIGVAGVIYLAANTNKLYKWNTVSYVEISPSEVVSVNTKTGVVVLAKADIGLSNVDNTSDLNKPISTATQDALDDKINILEKGAPNGVAPLNSLSKIDATYLPSYVDDVVEYANLAAFPPTGETSKIYVALDTNKIYRWSGSAYIEISTTDVIPISVENIRYVSKNGNDGTGDGSVNKPYLTITAAQNSIIDASPTKRYGIVVSAGTYTETGIFALKANVFIVGTSRDSVRIGATSFALASDFSGSADNRSGISQATILNNADFNWTTVTSAAGKLYFNEVSFNGTVDLYGYNNAIAQSQFDSCIIFGNFAISGINLGILTNTTYYGNITMSQHPSGGVPTLIFASGGSCSGTVTLNAIVNDFNRRCSLFARNLWMNGLTINGPSAYVDATISSIPKNGATITNNGNLVYIDAGANNRLSNLVAPTAVNESIIPASTNSVYSGDFGKQWFFNFAYVYASSGTDMYLTTYASSFTPDDTGRSIYITPDGAGLLSNVNSGEISLETAVAAGTGNTGNVTLKTGIPSGTGTRGKVLIDASQLDMNSKKIVNLLDPTAAQDAATKKYVDDELAGVVTSVNTRTGDIILTKVDVGLGDVDNTSDLNKPISTATQTALNGKANTSHTQDLSTINQSGATTGQVPVWSGTAWVPGVPAGTATWGGITGTLSLQTDLQSALDGKFDDPIGTTAEYIRGDGSLATFPTSINQANSLVTTVFNKSGAPIPKFSVVYISGGQGDLPTIALALANNEANSSKTYGVVYADIPNMTSGQVIVTGALTGLNTDQFNPTAPTGDVNGVALYLSPTVPGGVTTTKPSAPNHMVYVATIVRTHQNEGVIEVRIQNGFELQELHNVQIPNGSAQNNQVLKYDSATSLWKNRYIGLASDIEETSFSIANNQSSPANVTGFAFSNTLVKSFSAIVSVSIDATSDIFELFEIKGIQKSSEWNISISSTGDISGISFSITNTGQIQYTSNSYTGFVSGIIKFRAITTSV